MRRIYLSLLMCVAAVGSVSAQVNLTATGGTLSQSYTTVGAAFAAINAGTHTGAITLSVVSNTTETGPCVLNSGDATPASYTSVAMRAGADGVSISGATTTGRGLIELNGADNVTIDGDNPGTGGINRNLSIINTAANTVTYTSCVRIALSTLVLSANNNTIKNCNLTGSGTGRNISAITTEVTTWGVVVSGNASTSAVTTAPSTLSSATTAVGGTITATNLLISNNNIQTVARGISVNGSAATVATGLVISNNVIGNPAVGNPDQVYSIGITAQGSTDGIISGNTVRVEGYTNSSANTRGIDVGQVSTTAPGTFTIQNNIIERVVNNNPSTYPAVGINIQAGSNHLIKNNFIGTCVNSQTTGTGGFSTLFGAQGIRLQAGTGHKIYHNTVHLTGNVPGTVNKTMVVCLSINLTTITGCDVRNNIFSNQTTGGNSATTGNNAYACIYLPTGATSSMNLTMNNNACYGGTTPVSYIGQTGTTSTTGGYTFDNFDASSTSPATNFRSYTSTLSGAGTNDNATLAYVAAPLVISETDLHLQVDGANVVLLAGASGTGVTTDIDGTSRSGTNPVIGAHEVILPVCTGMPAAGTVVSSATSGCETFTADLSTTGTTSGVTGITYVWQYSPDDVVPYANISGATNPTYTATVTATGYYRARIGCNTSGQFSNTPGVQITSNPNPSAITGTLSACELATTTLSSSTGGGTWSSGNTSVATVDPSTGVVSAASLGTTTISYIVTATGCYTTALLNVNPSPSAITFTPSSAQAICLNSVATFTAAATALHTILSQDFNTSVAPWDIDNTGSSGGSSPAATMWTLRPSGYTAAAQVHTPPDGTQFIVTVSDAGGSGSATQTRLTSPSFSLAGYSSATLTFQHFYRYITTDAEASVQISTDGGAGWTTLQNYRTGAANVGSSSSFASATFDLTPYVGETNVMVRFFYQAGWGWSWAIDNIAVTGTPFLTYTWAGVSGADGLSCTSCASPDITPTTSGTKTYSVTTTAGGCSSTGNVTVTVNPLPVAITGTTNVCEGLTTMLTNTDGGGTWASGNTTFATVDPNTGVVTGQSAGVTNISYIFTATGCVRSTPFTVNATPAAIGGAANVCEGGTTTLTNTSGTWASDNSSVASIDASTGVVTANANGFANITFTNAFSCSVNRQVTVNPVATATVTPTLATVCLGDGATYTATADPSILNLLSQDFNGTLGNWTVTNGGGLPANQWTIVTSPSDLGITGDGSSFLQTKAAGDGSFTISTLTSPSFPTGGVTDATLTFNQTVFSFVPDVAASIEYSVNGGTWTLIENQATMVINGDGTWDAAMPEYTIALPAAAIGVGDVRLRWLYNGSAYGWAIDNIKLKGTLAPSTFAWSGDAGLSCTNCAAPVITPTASGTINYTVTTTNGGGCSINTPVSVSVNPLPATIGGTAEVCEAGSTTTLTNSDGGGTWTSSNTTAATVDMTSGVVTGGTAGNTTISYTHPVTGCVRTIEVTVNPLPSAITGIMEMCEAGGTTTLSSTPAGEVWSSSASATASIDASGVVTGGTNGNATITYTIASTGCMRTAQVTVNALPDAIGGSLEVCEGLTTTLTNATGGGTWESSNTTAATIDATTGIASGIAAGNSDITYTITSTGCMRSAELTVNALPGVITGIMEVCEAGGTTTLSSTPSGEVWSSSATGTASVDASGMVTGGTNGIATITYTIASTGCIRTTDVTVNALPALPGGSLAVCEGLTTTLTNATGGGTWESSNTAVATIGSGSGIVNGIAAGTSNVTYIVTATGCMRSTEFTVNALPAAIGGLSEVCNLSSITLTNTDAGGSWSSSAPTVATAGTAGDITGVMAGTTTITYTLPTSCIATHIVTVNALPEVYNVTGGGAYCAGGTGVSIGTDTSETGATYTLYDGASVAGSVTSTGGAVDFGLTTAAGTYTVTATSTESCVSDMAGSATVVITPLVTPAVSIAATPGDTVCAGTSTTFTATPVNGGTTPSYVWEVNGTTVATGAADTHSYIPADGDMVTVTLTSTEACPFPATATDTKTMVVISNETPTATIVVGPDDTVCQGSTAVFGAVSTFGGASPVYTWYKNTVSTGITGDTYSYIPVNGDVITAKLNSNYRCPVVNNVTSNAITMHVDSAYLPAVIVTPNTGLVIAPGQTVTFTATVTQGGSAPTYQWILNNVLLAGATNSTYVTSTIVNNDSVSCVVYGTGDCSYFTFNSVKMMVTNDVRDIAMNGTEIRLMPNPNSGTFTVTGTTGRTDATEVHLEVLNMLGQVVYTNTVQSKDGSLNEHVQLSNTLANGMYMLNVSTGTDRQTFHFVLKQ